MIAIVTFRLSTSLGGWRLLHLISNILLLLQQTLLFEPSGSLLDFFIDDLNLLSHPVFQLEPLASNLDQICRASSTYNRCIALLLLR